MRRLACLAFFSIILSYMGGNGGCMNVQPPNTPTITIPAKQPFTNGTSKLDASRAALVEYISKRTVRVVCRRAMINPLTDKVILNGQKCGWGTGTIIRSYKDKSYILTADHVVEADTTIDLFGLVKWKYYYLIEKRNLKNEVVGLFGGATVVRRDVSRDVAVLQIPYNLGIQTEISHSVVLGQEAHVIGYPGLVNIKGTHLSYTHGFISTMYMGNDKKKLTREHDRFDMDVYMGNSGSAVWNNRGEIVGMVNWVTGMRFSSGYFLPQPKQTFGCSARGLIKVLNKSGMIELSKF